VPEVERMKEKHVEYALWNNDKAIIEIRKVKDPKYAEGVIFTFRCMSSEGKTLFAIENSHGQPHLHWRNRKEDVDWDWKTAYMKFDEMMDEHMKKIGQR
jgi:hypothetical protein